MGQAALDARFQDGLRPRVPQWRAVLGQQVCELLAHLPEEGKRKDFRLVSRVEFSFLVSKNEDQNLIWPKWNELFVKREKGEKSALKIDFH